MNILLRNRVGRRRTFIGSMKWCSYNNINLEEAEVKAVVIAKWKAIDASPRHCIITLWILIIVDQDYF